MWTGISYRGFRLTAQAPYTDEVEMRWHVAEHGTDVDGVVVDSWNAAIDHVEAQKPIAPVEACFRCEWCGRYELPDHYSTAAALKAHRSCIGCHFWIGYVESRDNPRHLIVGGEHFAVGDERASALYGRGHGGRLFRWRDLRTHDEAKSTNLWAQGKIPDRFRAMLPDNAEWVGAES